MCLRVQVGDVVMGDVQSAAPVAMLQGQSVSNWTARLVRTPANADFITQLLSSYASGARLYDMCSFPVAVRARCA